MKNHAFIMPVHKQPGLLARIINVLQAENHYFFVHVSGQVENYNAFVDACHELENVIFVKRISVYHCGISQVYATMIMLDAVMDHPVHFDYVHQISGQDYPLRSNKQFDDFFEHTNDSFMCYNYEEDMERWRRVYDEQVNRYYNYGPTSVWDRFVVKIGNSRIGRQLFKRKPIPNLAGGWDWFSWSDRVVEFIYTTLKSKEGKKLLCRFKYTCAAGEHIWHTILYPYPDELNIRKHFPLRYISWGTYREVKQTHRPYDMNEEDYDRIINSAAFFCRKVEEKESAKLLDMIDKQRGTHFTIDKNGYFF